MCVLMDRNTKGKLLETKRVSAGAYCMTKRVFHSYLP